MSLDQQCKVQPMSRPQPNGTADPCRKGKGLGSLAQYAGMLPYVAYQLNCWIPLKIMSCDMTSLHRLFIIRYLILPQWKEVKGQQRRTATCMVTIVDCTQAVATATCAIYKDIAL